MPCSNSFENLNHLPMTNDCNIRNFLITIMCIANNKTKRILNFEKKSVTVIPLSHWEMVWKQKLIITFRNHTEGKSLYFAVS